MKKRPFHRYFSLSEIHFLTIKWAFFEDYRHCHLLTLFHTTSITTTRF